MQEYGFEVIEGVRVPQSEALIVYQTTLRNRTLKVEALGEQLESLHHRLKEKIESERLESKGIIRYNGLHREGSLEFGPITPEKEEMKQEFERERDNLEVEHENDCEHEIDVTR